MSTRPMVAPSGADDCRYAELMITLPPEWPGAYEVFSDPESAWPAVLLREVARMPHSKRTWLWHGHTVRDADPPQPFAPNTRLSCIVVGTPASLPKRFGHLQVAPGRTAHIFSMTPIYAEECYLAMQEGSELLLALLEAEGATDLLDIRRRSVVPQDPV